MQHPINRAAIASPSFAAAPITTSTDPYTESDTLELEICSSVRDEQEDPTAAKCAEPRPSIPATHLTSGFGELTADSEFPLIHSERLSATSEQALDLLSEACHELARYGDYAAVRKRICQLQIELNEYGLIAPSFRPRPKRLRAKQKGSRSCFTDADMAIHRDLIVIDCHWLYVRKVKVIVGSGDELYKPLFRRTCPFDYELAWMFANENWRSETRVATALHLRKTLQYQLSALRCKEVASDLERLKIGTRKQGRLLPSPLARVSIELQEWCDEDSRIETQVAAYEAIYQAYWLLGPLEKTTTIAELAGLIQGSLPLHPRTVSGKLGKLLTRMGEEHSRTGPLSDSFSEETTT